MKFFKLKNLRKSLAVAAVAASLFTVNGAVHAAGFTEYPIGDEQEDTVNKFKVALVYFQPVDMEPAGNSLPADQADMHIETDISATEGNETGFGVGEWIPYLTVHYKFTKMDGANAGQSVEGTFMPMSADDGPHYGANVKLLGAGKYKMQFKIESPYRSNYLLHVDDETGVPGRFWDTPVEMSWDFDFVPRRW